MGNSKIPAYGGGGCCGGSVGVPVARVVTAPIGIVDYSSIINKPSIEGVELVGDREMTEFGVSIVTDEDIEAMFA